MLGKENSQSVLNVALASIFPMYMYMYIMYWSVVLAITMHSPPFFNWQMHRENHVLNTVTRHKKARAND